MFRIAARDVRSLNPGGITWLVLPVERLPNGSGNTAMIRGSAEEDVFRPFCRRRNPNLGSKIIGSVLEEKPSLTGDDNGNNEHQ